MGYGFGYGMSYGSVYYILLVVPALLLSVFAQIAVKSAYSSMSRQLSRSGYTGATAAQAVLRYYGIMDVRIEQVSGKLTDHYDPRANVIRLSDGVYGSNSIAAIGIACHEAGHAAQHAQNYVPIRVRNSILPVTRIGSYLGVPLALIGFWIPMLDFLIPIGLGLYAFIMLFQLVTLPVEFNASRRAVQVIEETRLLASDDELQGAKKVLRCAAMTYVASLAVSMMNLLRLLLVFSRRRR